MDTTKLMNHGLYWSVGELKKLKSVCSGGHVTERIAYTFGRTQSACAEALRTVRKTQMLMHGDPDDTLITWKKKEERNG